MSTVEERKAAQLLRIEADKPWRKIKLRKAAMLRQEEIGFDTNFMIKIDSAIGTLTALGKPIGAKLKASYDGVQEIWDEYDNRVENDAGDDTSFDFSVFGSKPHSYNEVVDEIMESYNAS